MQLLHFVFTPGEIAEQQFDEPWHHRVEGQERHQCCNGRVGEAAQIQSGFPQKDTVEHMIAEAKGQVSTAQRASPPDKN
jgi:hypothetical protein